MNLPDILQMTSDAPNRVCRFEPYGSTHREQMVREILGLANADLQDDRYIVFGAHHDGIAMNIIGLTDADRNCLEDDISRIDPLIEADLDVKVNFETIDGKPIAVLQLRNCENPPYVVKETVSERLQRGECWIRKNGKIGLALRSDLDRMYGKLQPTESPSVLVGFNGRAECQVFVVEIPDRADPPSKRAPQKSKRSLESEQRTSETSIARARVVNARMYVAETALTEADNTIKTQSASEEIRKKRADIYYFFEERALKINFSILNKTRLTFEDATFELSFPRTSDFDISDKVYSPPDQDQSSVETDLIGYPDVEKTRNSIRVCAALGAIQPEREIDAFECAIRLAVGTGWRGKKLGIHYALKAGNLKKPFTGRLKIIFNP
jgi:hypothetical protein